MPATFTGLYRTFRVTQNTMLMPQSLPLPLLIFSMCDISMTKTTSPLFLSRPHIVMVYNILKRKTFPVLLFQSNFPLWLCRPRKSGCPPPWSRCPRLYLMSSPPHTLRLPGCLSSTWPPPPPVTAYGTIWHLGQFDTNHARRTIWHLGQFVT